MQQENWMAIQNAQAVSLIRSKRVSDCTRESFCLLSPTGKLAPGGPLQGKVHLTKG